MIKGSKIYFSRKFCRIIIILLTTYTYLFGIEVLAQSVFIEPKIIVGAQREKQLLPLLQNKKIGIVANKSSIIDEQQTLLPERLLSLGFNVVCLFSPEHGFREFVDAGETVQSSLDYKTGLKIISLYGSHKKPTREDLKGIDILLFDLQDVGVRFFTYISTMHYCMEAVADIGIPIVVLDRPNPNDYIDGPVLETDCKSFIGMHPIPLLYGMTIGELALMINGEGWLKTRDKKCQLIVIPIEGWQHGQKYSLPTPPSPNLRSDIAVRLYPSICLFEASILSVGRGTDSPFTLIGYPDNRFGKFYFIPKPQLGAKKPKYKGQKCYGESLENFRTEEPFSIEPFLRYYRLAKKLGYNLIEKKRTLELLIGNKSFLKQVKQLKDEKTIRESWQKDLERYRKIRKKYLIYTDIRKINP